MSNPYYSKKADIIAPILAALEEWKRSNGGCDDEDAINRFKSLCLANVPPLEYCNINCSLAVREKFSKAKARKCSFYYVYKQGPDKALSSILMTTLFWDVNVSFPYLLDTEVAQESDDEDDD